MHERGDGDGNDDDGNDGDSDSDLEIQYMIPRPSPRRHAILDRDRDRGCDDVLVEAMMAEIAELATRESRLVAELAASHRRECDLAQNLASMEQKYTDALSHLSLQHSGRSTPSRGTPSRGSAGAPDVQEQYGCSAVTTGKVLATSAAWGERAQTTAKLVRRVVKKKVVPRSRAPPASEPAYILKTIGSDNDLDSGNGMDPGSVPARARLTALDYPPSHHQQPMHACACAGEHVAASAVWLTPHTPCVPACRRPPSGAFRVRNATSTADSDNGNSVEQARPDEAPGTAVPSVPDAVNTTQTRYTRPRRDGHGAHTNVNSYSFVLARHLFRRGPPKDTPLAAAAHTRTHAYRPSCPSPPMPQLTTASLRARAHTRTHARTRVGWMHACMQHL